MLPMVEFSFSVLPEQQWCPMRTGQASPRIISFQKYKMVKSSLSDGRESKNQTWRKYFKHTFLPGLLRNSQSERESPNFEFSKQIKCYHPTSSILHHHTLIYHAAWRAALQFFSKITKSSFFESCRQLNLVFTKESCNLHLITSNKILLQNNWPSWPDHDSCSNKKCQSTNKQMRI